MPYPMKSSFELPHNLRYISTPDEPYACPVGVAIWESYRATHPEAPTVPPESTEDLQDAVDYWLHVSSCPDCNEE